MADIVGVLHSAILNVSIPKRVSEVLWLSFPYVNLISSYQFQSLKGFQRFCGCGGMIAREQCLSQGFNP